jgi:hypothetical protein
MALALKGHGFSRAKWFLQMGGRVPGAPDLASEIWESDAFSQLESCMKGTGFSPYITPDKT